MSSELQLMNGGGNSLAPISDPAAIAAAETVKAYVQSSYIMAYQKPRNVMLARTRILEAVRRPVFAKNVEYKKPVGKIFVTGANVRFAELALQVFGNMNSTTQIVYEDDTMRRVAVRVTDFETNASYVTEIVIKKTVERTYPDASREVVGERLNSKGAKVFIVKATDDELDIKQGSAVSKALRNSVLRLIPVDIVEEALSEARKVAADADAKDPLAAKLKMIDAFAAIGIKPNQLEQYLGHSLDEIVPAELTDLRAIHTAIKDGEARWSDFIQATPPADMVNPATGEVTQQPPQSATAALADKLKNRGGRPAGSKNKPKEEPPAPVSAPPETEDDVPDFTPPPSPDIPMLTMAEKRDINIRAEKLHLSYAQVLQLAGAPLERWTEETGARLNSLFIDMEEKGVTLEEIFNRR